MRITRGHILLALFALGTGIFWAMKMKSVATLPSNAKILQSPPKAEAVIPSAPIVPAVVSPKKPVAPRTRAAPQMTKKSQKPSSKKRTGETSKNKAGQRFHVVRRGECLWVISRRYYGKGKLWTEIYKVNRARIKNPRKIYSGQRLQIPSV